MWGGPMTREIERCGRRSKTAVAGFGATGEPVAPTAGRLGGGRALTSAARVSVAGRFGCRVREVATVGDGTGFVRWGLR